METLEKKYMLSRISERLEDLKHKYWLTCQGLNFKGEPASPNGAAWTRSKVKKDICAIVLVQDLLMVCKDDEVKLTDDALLGFDRLIGE